MNAWNSFSFVCVDSSRPTANWKHKHLNKTNWATYLLFTFKNDFSIFVSQLEERQCEREREKGRIDEWKMISDYCLTRFRFALLLILCFSSFSSFRKAQNFFSISLFCIRLHLAFDETGRVASYQNVFTCGNGFNYIFIFAGKLKKKEERISS